MTLNDALKDDLRRIEDVCIKVGSRRSTMLESAVYWIAVAVLHLLQSEVKRREVK